MYYKNNTVETKTGNMPEYLEQTYIKETNYRMAKFYRADIVCTYINPCGDTTVTVLFGSVVPTGYMQLVIGYQLSTW